MVMQGYGNSKKVYRFWNLRLTIVMGHSFYDTVAINIYGIGILCCVSMLIACIIIAPWVECKYLSS